MPETATGRGSLAESRLHLARKFFTIVAFVLFSGDTLPATETVLQTTDRLFAARDNVENLRQAIALLEKGIVSTPKDYELFWRLAKYNYYLADQIVEKNDRLKHYDTGVDLAKRAIGIDDNRPEGHFWLAANYGEYAELKGPFRSLWLVRIIRQEFERAFAIDRSFENGSLYLALGELYLRLPWLMGGNHQRGIEFLEEGIKAAPSNADLCLTLAEYYLKDGRLSDARKLAGMVLTLSDPLRSPKELEELRSRSRILQEKLGK